MGTGTCGLAFSGGPVTLGAALAVLALSAAGCAPAPRTAAPAPVASPALPHGLTPAPGVPGQPDVGAQLVVAKGCGGCHTISGVPGASGVAGPDITNVVLRPTLAGDTIPMSPDNLTAWLLNPPALKPGTAMPNLGLSQQEAQDIAAFLYSQPDNPQIEQ